MEVNLYLGPKIDGALKIEFSCIPRPFGSYGDRRDDSGEILFLSFLREAIMSSSGKVRHDV